MPYTQGFRNEWDWNYHFDRHGFEFGATTREEYLALADEFFGTPADENTHDYIRPSDQALVRCNTRTEAIGVLHRDGFIGTYIRSRNKRKFPSILDKWREFCK